MRWRIEHIYQWGGYVGKVLCVQQDVTLDGNVTFQECELVMEPNVTIYVEPTAVLTIAASHLYSCEAMWNGIVVRPGGRVIITGFENKSSFFEDAIIGVEMQMNFDNTSYFTNLLEVDNTIFNKNHTSISIKDYYVYYFSFVYPFSIKNAIFTCREISFSPGTLTWDNLETVKSSPNSASTVYPNTPDVMSDPYINESNYSSTNSNSFLKSPFNSTPTKSENGISITNVASTDGDWVSVQVGVLEGDERYPNTVIFDSHVKGIYAYSSNVVVYNCTFQKKYQPLSLTRTQYGILSENYYDDPFSYGLKVINPLPGVIPNNAFFDLDCAISTSYIRQNVINHTDIRSSMNVTDFDPQNPGFMPSKAERGIYILSRTDDPIYFSFRVYIDNNKIYNILKPIEQFSLSQYFNGISEINYNKIGLYSPEVNPQNYPSYGAIYDAIAISHPDPFSYFWDNTEVICDGNEIDDALTGIRLSSFKVGRSVVKNNNIHLRETVDYTGGPGNVLWGYGIIMQNVTTIKDMQNLVLNNQVVGDKQTAIQPPQNYGISINQCDNLNVGCNDMSEAVADLHFYGANVPANVKNNKMFTSLNLAYPTMATYGLMMEHNAIIGRQGNFREPCTSDNDWISDNSSWAANNAYKTFCLDFTDSRLSELIVRNTSNYNPDGSATQNFSIEYSIAQSSIYTSTTSDECVSCANTEYKSSLLQKGMSDTTAAEYIALGKIPIPAADSLLRMYVMQQQLYSTLLANKKLQNSSTILQQFFNKQRGSNFEQSYAISKSIAENDTASAYNKLQNFLPANRVDDHIRKFYTWVLNNYPLPKAKQNAKLDLQEIFNIANLCPYKDGTVVYAARNLYNYLANKPVFFKDDCNTTVGKPITAISKSKVDVNQLMASPNPSPSGSFLITFKDKKALNTIVELLDNYGKKIKQIPYNGQSTLQVTIDGPKGIYFLRASNENKGTNAILKLIKL